MSTRPSRYRRGLPERQRHRPARRRAKAADGRPDPIRRHVAYPRSGVRPASLGVERADAASLTCSARHRPGVSVPEASVRAASLMGRPDRKAASPRSPTATALADPPPLRRGAFVAGHGTSARPLHRADTLVLFALCFAARHLSRAPQTCYTALAAVTANPLTLFIF